MKRILLYILMIVGFLEPLQAQITLFPVVKSQDVPHLYIRKIELTDQFTMIHFYYNPMGESLICADRSFHLVPEGTEQMLYMVRAKDIPICPKRMKVGVMNVDHEFEIWFPKLERKVYHIDVIESTRDGFNFHGVTINNGQQRPLPDTSIYRTREEFEEYFSENSDSLKRIEGIWTINQVMDHYGYDQVVDKNYKETSYDVAIIRNGSRYLVYELDGTPLEAEYIDVAGGRGHYFSKYFRDIHTEINAYVTNMTEDFFTMEYELPERLAHEELLDKYSPGDRILIDLEVTRLFPGTGNNKDHEN